MVRRCVWSRNLVNEEALAHWRLLCQKKKTTYTIHTGECFLRGKMAGMWSSTPNPHLVSRLRIPEAKPPFSQVFTTLCLIKVRNKITRIYTLIVCLKILRNTKILIQKTLFRYLTLRYFWSCCLHTRIDFSYAYCVRLLPRSNRSFDTHHKHQGLDPLIRSVSRAIASLANVF